MTSPFAITKLGSPQTQLALQSTPKDDITRRIANYRPPPGEFDEDNYREHILREARIAETIIFSTVFSPDGEYAVCANNFGRIGIWRIGTYMEEEYWDDESNTSTPSSLFSFQAHDSQIYSLKFAGNNFDCILISGGDQEIKIWKWSDLLRCINEDPLRTPFKARPRNLAPSAVLPNSQSSIGNKGAMAPVNETNDLAVNNRTNHVFAASGDGNCYEWDLNSAKMVRTYSGHKDYLQCVSFLECGSEIATGSEDGTIGVWDIRTSNNICFLHPKPANCPSEDLWVTCMDVDSTGSWLVAGGGAGFSNFSTQNGVASGFFGMWHIPSRAQILCNSTIPNVHGIAFHQDEIVTVGNQACVNYWDRRLGTKKTSIGTLAPSCYVASVNHSERNKVLAVAGVSPFVNIYTLTGVNGFTLHFD